MKGAVILIAASVVVAADAAREPPRPARYAAEIAAAGETLMVAEKNADEAAAFTALMTLGNLELGRARGAEAAGYYERALVLQENRLGKDDVRLIDVLTRLGNAYALPRSGSPARAEAAYLRTVAIAEKAYGAGHSEVAYRLFVVARFHESRKHYAAARYYYERRLAIVEKTFGPEHRSTGATLAALGTIHLREEDYWEAEMLLKRALPILEKDNDVSYYAANLERLAEVYAATARPGEADELRARARALRRS